VHGGYLSLGGDSNSYQVTERGIRKAFKFALDHMKRNDAMIVGMFQEFGDQARMNARIVRELCS